MQLNAIVAMSKNRVIGHKGEMPWPRLPRDMKRFRDLTMGQPVIMGRKTWESIPEKFRPLPGRTNIVLTRNEDFQAPGAQVAFTKKEAIAMASGALTPDNDNVWIIGGGEIYALFMKEYTRIWMTQVNAEYEGDAFFPEKPANFVCEEGFTEDHEADAKNPVGMRFLTFARAY